jgi:ferrous iron transport protein A
MTLADLKPNTPMAIRAAAPEDPRLQSKLYALGLIPGATLSVLRFAPFGDPMQVRVGHALISIRRMDAAAVVLQPA